MDIEETRNAYERATMPDKQTMQDHIDDLMIELKQTRQELAIADLELRHLRQTVAIDDSELQHLRQTARLEKATAERWRKIAAMPFTLAGGHITGCKMGVLCNCGYAHYEATINNEQQAENKK